VAKRRPVASAEQRGRPATSNYSERAISLLSQRDALMAEIAILRSQANVPPSSIGKASTLLTRYWSRGNWQTRAEILRAARWLLNVGRMQSLTDAAPTR
jgi:hypothetical protein